jgi:membrane-associated phospholipid phosphatase
MKSQALFVSFVRRNACLKYGDELIELNGIRIAVARFISRVTPAPLINFYVGLIFAWFSPIGLGPFLTPLESLLLCIALMVIMPVIPIIIEAARGKTDLDVSQRESRTKFFLFSLLCYSLSYLVYNYFGCIVMSSLAAAYFTVTLGVTVISLRSKISVHGAGVGGPGTALILVFGLSALPVILVWIAVIWARIILHQHSLAQSVGGVLAGLIITFMTYPFVYIF